MTGVRLLSVGEVMAEIRLGAEGGFVLGFAGDTYNTAVYAARLSGLLIGAELAIGLEAHDREPLILAASDGAADRYLAACALLDIACRRVDAEAAVRDGLYALASRIWPERKLQGRPT